MSNEHNDRIAESKYEDYKSMLEQLDDEFLAYEYSDRIGSECGLPNRETQIDQLADRYGVCLYEDLDIDWVADWLKEYRDNSKGKINCTHKCSCGSKEDLRPSGFGGFSNPKWFYTCQACIDESQDEYERQQIETEIFRPEY